MSDARLFEWVPGKPVISELETVYKSSVICCPECGEPALRSTFETWCPDCEIRGKLEGNP